MTHDDLVATLEQSQRLGFLGDRPIPQVIEHAHGFVSALEGVSGHVVDLGSGGGVPGFVIAALRPDLELTLVDRRTKRTDFLDRMVRRLGLRDRIHVRAADTEELIADVGGSFDAAVARGFGPPLVTLETGTRLVRGRGLIIISEPPEGDRWNDGALDGLGVARHVKVEGVAVFQTVG